MQPDHHMDELIDTTPEIDVQESEYRRLLGYPPYYTPGDRARDLAAWARSWYAEHGRPWIYAVRSDEISWGKEKLIIAGAVFESEAFRSQLSDAHADSVMLTAVSAGRECEEMAQQLWQEGRPDEYFFLEIYGSAVVEHLVTAAGARLCAWADEQKRAVLPHYSPGYTGWRVADQKPLMSIISGKAKNRLPGDLQLLDSGMLKPKKSMLAVFGITGDVEKTKKYVNLIPCSSCALPGCRYRRKPYRKHRKPVENMEDLLGNGNDGGDHTDTEPKYSVSRKALEKWAAERLEIRHEQDGMVSAVFRYDGTTCSNLGHPIKFDYRIRLGPKADGYKIIGLDCFPGKDDDGFTYMCEYIRNPDALMAAVRSCEPLLGKPLDQVFTWRPEYDPAGCFCNAGARDYKWGLVLETLHFGLMTKV